LINESIELSIGVIESPPQGKRENGVVAGEHGHGGAKYAGIEEGEQAGDLPAVRGDEVTMGARWAVDQA